MPKLSSTATVSQQEGLERGREENDESYPFVYVRWSGHGWMLLTTMKQKMMDLGMKHHFQWYFA
jgi:hypothetical protein